MPDNMRNESAIKHMLEYCVEIERTLLEISYNRGKNVVAHKYGAFDFDILWETVTSDIPALKEFCKKTTHVFSIAFLAFPYLI